MFTCGQQVCGSSCLQSHSHCIDIFVCWKNGGCNALLFVLSAVCALCCLCSLLFVLSAIVRDRECCRAGQQSELSPSVDQQEVGGGEGGFILQFVWHI